MISNTFESSTCVVNANFKDSDNPLPFLPKFNQPVVHGLERKSYLPQNISIVTFEAPVSREVHHDVEESPSVAGNAVSCG